MQLVSLSTSFSFISPAPTSSAARRRSSSLLKTKRPPSAICSASAGAAAAMGGSSAVAEFPYLSTPHKELMAALLAAINDRLGSDLMPSAVPEDIRLFRSPANADTAGALDILPGRDDSVVDFILESWLHCKLPMGSLNITTITAFLSQATDAPHLLMEFIQSSPSSLVLIIDLLPRKDLVLHPDYLKEYYETTHLDKQRQELYKLPQVNPYYSPSLFVRSALSPTSIAVEINCGEDGKSVMEEIMGGPLDGVAKEIVKIWLDKCASSSKKLEENEKEELIARDKIIKNKTIEIDLTANLPRLFGPDIANKVVETIQKVYRV